MDEKDIEHRLTEVEQRSKSNAHRIDDLEETTKAINSLATSMQVMVSEQKHQTSAMTEIKADVAKLDSKVETIERKPAKRWDSLVNQLITIIVAAVAGFILAKIGL
jgi:tetrahydromethanopterin S-methyltransferase subunit G